MNKQGFGAGNGLHMGPSHMWQHVFSRRQLMKTAAGTAGLGMISGLGVPNLARAQAGSGEPKPIPGGVMAFGVPVHHFPLPLSVGKPLSEINGPSEITDFNGFVGGVHILGEGNGTGFDTPLGFQTDMGFMQGEFLGESCETHNWTFVFIDMALS